ncbi:MAG: tetratricopeptide repeat protein, partial [Cytophagaceae bacterium]
RSVLALAKTLSPDDPDKDSSLLQQARERYEAGDFSGANDILSEANIDGMIARAEAKRQEAKTIDQKAAQAFLAKANALAGAKPDTDWLDEAVRFCERAVGTNDEIDTLFAAASFLQAYNQSDKAVNLYERILLLEEVPFLRALALNNLALLINTYPGKALIAREYYQEALILYRQFYEVAPEQYALGRANTSNNLGILLSNNPDEYGMAREYFETALDLHRHLARKMFTADMSDVAGTLNNLANLLAKQSDQYVTAKEYYDEALKLYRELALTTPTIYLSNVAGTLFNLASLLAKQSDQYVTAKEYYDEALKLYRELALATPTIYLSNVALTLTTVSRLLLRSPSDYAIALQNFREALQILRQLDSNTKGISSFELVQTLLDLSCFYIMCVPNKEQSIVYVREAYERIHLRLAEPLAISLAEICLQIAVHWREKL